MSGFPKILLIGLDSADKDLVIRWANEGVLPTFRKLQERGAWGVTETPPRIYNGAVWPCACTGVAPGGHERYFYIRLDGYHVNGLRHLESKHETFWEELNRAGKRIALIDVPYAPKPKNLNGIQISDWLVHDPNFIPPEHHMTDRGEAAYEYRSAFKPQLQTFPSTLREEVLRFGHSKEVVRHELSGRTSTAFKNYRDRLVRRIENKAELCAHYMKQESWDLFFAVFHEPHDVGHECWHIHDPKHRKHDPELRCKIGNPMKDVYVAADKAIARLLEETGPETLVYILCSHGMGPVSDGNHALDDILSQLESTPTPMGLNIVSWLNRAWARMPGPLRMALSLIRNRVRKQVHEALVGSNRGRRRCFAIPTNGNMGGVRINLVGREPNGFIHPGAEFNSLCEQLKSDLLDLVDAETGEPIVRAVVGYEDLYPRGPLTEDLYDDRYLGDKADLLIIWDKLSFTAVSSPKVGRVEVTSQNSRTGDHKDGGLLIAFGPGIKPAHLTEIVPVTTLAPTISAALGVSLSDSDGTACHALMPEKQAAC